MRKILLILGIGLMVFTSVKAQNVGINSTGASPDASAGLDVNFTDKGVLISRVNITDLSTAAPVTSPATSLIVYNTNTSTGTGYYYWDGSQWVKLFDSNDGKPWLLEGNSGTTAGTNFLGTTDNVSLSFKTNNTERMRILNTGYVGIGTTTPAELLQLNGNIRGNQSGALRISTGNGYVDVGPKNSSWSHFYTDRPRFWFNKGVTVDGGLIGSYNEDLQLQRAGTSYLWLRSSEAVFNENSANYDFRIESDGQDDMFFVDASANRIGINTTSPAGQIQFISTGENIWLTQWDNNSSSNGAIARFQHTSSSNGNRVFMGVTNYSGSSYTASAVIGLSLNSSGSGGVGVYGSANNEDGNAVEGYLAYSGSYSGWAGYFNADVYCGGTYYGSDRRLKKDIKPIDNALDIVMRVKPVEYYFNTDKYPYLGLDENRLSYGFIAQDLEKVVPTMVKEKYLNLHTEGKTTLDMAQRREVEKFKVVNYTLMIPILTEAIQEQQQIIEDLKKRIEQLEQKNKADQSIK